MNLPPAVRRLSLLRLLLLLAVSALFVRTAWVCDDAFITFRVSQNLADGFGPRWNLDERVWVFTNPLWMLLMAGVEFVGASAFLGSIALSGFLGLTSVTLLLWHRGLAAATILLLGALMLSSKAFIDFMSSGLETPLLYLLMTVFGLLTFSRRELGPRTVFVATLLSSFVLLTRMDAALLVLPPLLVLALRVGWKASWRPLGLGLLPFLTWASFALIYYGTVVPNTAYAKLSAGLPRSYYLTEGIGYFWDSLRMDPVTLPTLLIAIFLGLRSRTRSARAMAAGIVLYLLYVLWIGGDFMSGRFYAVPFIVALVLLVSELPASPSRVRVSVVAGLSLLALGSALLHPLANWKCGADYHVELSSTVQNFSVPGKSACDERAYYFPDNGLITAKRGRTYPDHQWAAVGDSLRGAGTTQLHTTVVGMVGYFGGPGLHIVDANALTDPFLSRAPTPEGNRPRVGHVVRGIPREYLDSLRSGRNMFRDPEMAQYYEAVRLVHAGPIWKAKRWREVFRLMSGSYDGALEAYYRRGEQELTR